MTPDKISKRVAADRLEWIARMVGEIRYELYEICTNHLMDVETIATAYRFWLNEHPEYLDSDL